MSKEDVKTWTGEKLDISWDKRLCIHVAECGRAEGELFVGGRDPWCNPDSTPTMPAIEVVKRCPTGALSYNRKDDGEGESAPEVNTATVVPRGPLYFHGELNIAGAEDDMEGVKYRAALCRCGASKNKPFCDNSHEESGFADRGAVGAKGMGQDEPGGPLTIRKIPNGPLILLGNLQIRAGNGEIRWKGQKAALCRCGHSAKKPFCDGAHAKAGFEAE